MPITPDKVGGAGIGKSNHENKPPTIKPEIVESKIRFTAIPPYIKFPLPPTRINGPKTFRLSLRLRLSQPYKFNTLKS